jgi:hypothetical protein
MKKTKVTVKSLREELKNVQENFDVYREKTRAYIFENASLGNRRRLMSITPANEKGMINGMTIPELVMLVNLNEGTGEVVLLETENNKKDLVVIAKKKGPRTPVDLL